MTNEQIARLYYDKMQAACNIGGTVIMGLPEGYGTAQQDYLVARQGESFDAAMARHNKAKFLRRLQKS